MTKYLQRKQQEEPDAIPNMAPFVAKNKLPNEPTNEDIIRCFDQLLEDLDYRGRSLTAFANWSVQQKLEFVRQQELNEKRVPSPEWLIEQYAKVQDEKLINSINLSIRTSRLSWVDRFCTSGGHILLLRELARLTSFSQFFYHSFPYKNKADVDQVVKALKSCVDCRHGSQHLLYFLPGIAIITSAINKYDFPLFETLLYLLIPYIFMETGPKLLVSAFKHLAELNQQKHSFRVFTDILSSNQMPAAKSKVFLAFLNGLYTTLSQNYPDKVDIVFQYIGSDLINKFRNLPEDVFQEFGPSLPLFLDSIKLDTEEIGKIFNGDVFKCAKPEDLVLDLNKQQIGAVLANLASIKHNNPQEIERIIAFFYNFLLFYRKEKNQDKDADFETTSFKAYEYAVANPSIQAPILPIDSQIENNTCYQYLHEEFNFVADSDINIVADSWTGGVKEREINDLKEQVQSLQAQLEEAKKEAEEARKVAEEIKLNNAQADAAELEKFKAELERKNQEEIAKFKDEFEAIKAENERLRASQNIITDLAAFIPNLKEISLKPLEIEQIIPSGRVDINALLAQIAKLRAQFANNPEVDAVLALLEAQLRKLIDERAATERNAASAIKAVREDRVALTAEYNQIREVQIKIIDGISRGILLGDVIDETPSEKIETKLQPNVAPSSPLFNVPWHKLPDQNASTKEWANILSEMPQLNQEEIHRYFAVGDIPEGKLISSLSERRLSHILKKAKLTPENIAKEINSQSFKIGEELLTLIYHLPVSQPEIERIAAYNGDFKDLSDEEKLAVLLYRIPSWRQNVSQSIELHKFDHDITIIEQNLLKISAALKQIKASTKLPVLIREVLALGNHVNGGTEYGGCSAFSFGDLKSLKNIKTNIKSVSLLNYIAFCVQKQGFDYVALQSELDKLQPASRFTLLDINEKLKNAQILLATRPRDPFVRASSRRIFDLMKKVDVVQKEYDDLEKVFGIQEELLRPGTLLNIIIEFAADFSRALKENRSNGLSGGQAARRPTLSQKPQQPVSPTPQEEDTQRGILTKMVGALSTVSRAPRNQNDEEEISDFQKAFLKVRKSVT